MTHSFETFIQAYQKAPRAIQQIIDSDTIALFVDSLASDHSIPEAHLRSLRIITANRLLGITSDTVVEELLQELISAPQLNTKISSLIKAFIHSKLDGVVLNAITQTEATTQQHTIATPTTTVINLATEIAETEASLNAIPHIRTMAADMTKSHTSGEQVYSSTQEAILKGGWSTPQQNQLPTTPSVPVSPQPSQPPRPPQPPQPIEGKWG